MHALLQRGAHAEALSHGGRAALHEAAGSGSEGGGGAACVRLLLRYGADPQRTDLQGRTALELAREAGRNDCVEACSTSLHAAWTAQAQQRGRAIVQTQPWQPESPRHCPWVPGCCALERRSLPS